MKRLTTDTPKDNLEAALNLFYIKDYETWVRGYGPAPEYADVSLFDLTRDIVKTHIPDAELPADNDNLSNMMPEWLMDGIDSAEGVVALLYTAAWAYAELRHKLMRYEDTGLEPEEIERILDSYGRGMTLRTENAQRLEIIKEIPINRLRELAQAKKEGRLVVLPCDVGDKLYDVTLGEVREKTVISLSMLLSKSVNHLVIHAENFRNAVTSHELQDIGKNIFLTREAAEAALEEMEADHDR